MGIVDREEGVDNLGEVDNQKEEEGAGMAEGYTDLALS